MNEILVDEFGYTQFFEELEKLKQLSLNKTQMAGEAIKEAVGDGWHDNFAYEEAMREERNIATRISKMLEEQKMLKIIELKSLGNEFINIGDSFEIEICYDIDDRETEKLTLTGKYKPNTDLVIKEITLNSPIGKAVYQQKINSSVSYFVNENKIDITILRKI